MGLGQRIDEDTSLFTSTEPETPCDQSQGFLRHQHRFRRLPGGNRLLVWISKTFGPTRSDSGDTEAAQEALRTRMFSGRFQGGRQARLHALPVHAQLAPGRESEFDRIEHARQPGAIEIPLDQPVTAKPTVGTAVEALRERLARVVLTAVAILREFGLNGGDLMQLGGASSCNHALDGVYKAPGGTHPYASAKAALPALVADFLDSQIIAQADDLVGQMTMQAAPVRRQLALGRSQTPAGLLVAPTFPPHAPPLAAASCFDAPLRVVVLGIVGPSLSLQMTLQSPARARIGCQFLGEEQQARRADLGHDGQRGRSQVESHRSLARQVFGLLQGVPRQNELHTVHEAPTVGTLCLGRGCPMPEQAHVLDTLLQSVVDHLILPVDQSRNLFAVPTEPALVAVRTHLQVKAQPRAVGLALDRVQTSSCAAKAHPAGLAHADPIGRLVGPARQLLGHEAVDVLGEPAGTQAFGRLVQAVFGEPILCAQTSEGLPARGLVGTGNAARSLPGRVGLHAPETFHRLGKQGIVDLAPAFKMSLEMSRMVRVHPQGQRENKRGGRLRVHVHSA